MFKNNGKIKLLIIVGTRPEIIRLAAVINKCREYFDCADDTVPLQAQDAAGNATAIEPESSSGGRTSRHGGGSSSCDAGFGLIALAAVALAARKVRK